MLTLVSEELCRLLVEFEEDALVLDLIIPFRDLFEPSLGLCNVFLCLAIESGQGEAKSTDLLLTEYCGIILIDVVGIERPLDSSIDLCTVDQLLSPVVSQLLTQCQQSKCLQFRIIHFLSQRENLQAYRFDGIVHLLSFELADQILQDPGVLYHESIGFLGDILDLIYFLSIF